MPSTVFVHLSALAGGPGLGAGWTSGRGLLSAPKARIRPLSVTTNSLSSAARTAVGVPSIRACQEILAGRPASGMSTAATTPLPAA